ncbi:hypothetical protein PoB_005516700 [Plakobranchus ocellatus]|uniref:Uncharacterized protein n=1 Tax=Plakobranchus ocellatus TaxID=259542 RepID=A0AAV4CAV6_9GAST|nr:hypothetical protein PoB_005516700 [Plakobranchus ocellatus]
MWSVGFVFLYTASQQQGDLRLSGSPPGQDAGGGARTRDRRVPADLRADSLATVPPTPPTWSVGGAESGEHALKSAWILLTMV